MARTTLVRNFLRTVCETLQDISPQFSRWPEHELVVYANFAQMALAKYLPQVSARTDSIRLLPGTRQDLTLVPSARILPGDGSAPADVAGIALMDIPRNMGADGATPGRVVRVADRYSKDTNDPDWHTRTGAVVREYVYDKNQPRVFYVIPGVPIGPQVWSEVAWLTEPTRIPAGGAPGSELYAYDGASVELMGIGDQYIEDAHNYVVAVALTKGSKANQNIPKSQYHAGMFTASLNAQAQVVSGVSPNLKSLPFMDQIAVTGEAG